MNERLRLHGIGLYLSQCPMVGQALEIVEHNMCFCIGQPQHLYENCSNLLDSGTGPSEAQLRVVAPTI